MRLREGKAAEICGLWAPNGSRGRALGSALGSRGLLWPPGPQCHFRQTSCSWKEVSMLLSCCRKPRQFRLPVPSLTPNYRADVKEAFKVQEGPHRGDNQAIIHHLQG